MGTQNMSMGGTARARKVQRMIMTLVEAGHRVMIDRFGEGVEVTVFGIAGSARCYRGETLYDALVKVELP